jgi:hypothetical protein
MASSTIFNASSRPLNQVTGTVPDVSGALKDWFQPLTYEPVTKTNAAFQVIETGAPVSFWGLIQPIKRNLDLMEVGQRAWTWLRLIAEPTIMLEVDDVVLFNGVQTRVMTKNDFSLYGYCEFSLIQDFLGVGP